jgi:hypothetical protein
MKICYCGQKAVAVASDGTNVQAFCKKHWTPEKKHSMRESFEKNYHEQEQTKMLARYNELRRKPAAPREGG